MKLTLFLYNIPTYSLSSLPPSSSSCGLYWGWPLQGWSAQDETPPRCPRSRYSPAHNDICAHDGAVFAYLLPKILDDACNKLLKATSELDDVFLWSRVTVSFCSSWNDEKMSSVYFHLVMHVVKWHQGRAPTCQRERSSEPRSSPYSLIPSSLPSWQIGCWSLSSCVEYHYHQHRSVDQL